MFLTPKAYNVIPGCHHAAKKALCSYTDPLNTRLWDLLDKYEHILLQLSVHLQVLLLFFPNIPDEMCLQIGSLKVFDWSNKENDQNSSLTRSFSLSVSLACPPGTFKSSQGTGLCLQCPSNSRSTSEAATICVCRNGYYRADGEKPDMPCTSESLSSSYYCYCHYH